MPDESSLGVWLFSASVDDSSPGGWVSGSIPTIEAAGDPGNAGDGGGALLCPVPARPT